MKMRLRGRVARSRTIVLLGMGLASLAAIALLAVAVHRREARSLVTGEQLYKRARAALQREKFETAETLAAQIEPSDEYWGSGRLVAGEAATRTGHIDAALASYAAVPRDGSRTAIVAGLARGELLREIGRLTDAEREYAYVLDHQPDDALVHERMAFLLGVTGRRWESLPHLMFLLKSGFSTWEQLVLLGDLERPVDQKDFLRRCAERAPGDLFVQMGLAAFAVADGRAADALPILRDVVARAPDFVAAQCLLGELLVDEGTTTFADWDAELPAAADDYPDTWFVRGLWARRRGDLAVASRCFWESIRRAPTHRRSTYQLGQVLVGLGETSVADFAERSEKLVELTQKLDNVLRSRGKDEPSVRRVTQLLEESGRLWEARAWALAAAQTFPEARWPEPVAQRLSGVLADDTPQTIDAANLALKYDLSGFPDHRQLLGRVEPRPVPDGASRLHSAIRFEEESDKGLDFVYFNGADPSGRGARMFEQTGGGVAVVDFDRDSLPDLYFPQGCQWKRGSAHPAPSSRLADRLYRNLGGRTLIDVSGKASLTDCGFGQGCAAGDYDNDGFSDLYVGNIGTNQLLHNNGDGTFSDVTATCGIAGETWTTSCVIVDLNADGNPDLFDVTYVTGPRVYEAVCNNHACTPNIFDGIPDRLHLSRGDGTFETVPDATPIENSKGMGVVAFDFEIRGRPSLFIANDQVASHFLRNSPAPDRFNLRFEEQGFARGLAFNDDGLALAGMGIAADDVNGDGRIDFYVTTFKDESKILYLQDASGLFVDATNIAGLRAPSMAYVGWGTQFIDADCDGDPDIVVVNGHVDDYRSEGIEYQMRPQVFRNLGSARFTELPAAEAGSYFQRKYLGRGLAKLDWNGDGRMDFVVSNIGAAASLVTNRSMRGGHYLNLRLSARATARDAIGSVVDVFANGRRWSRQLVAGDGFMASNERTLQFGLGEAAGVSELTVHWPSGGTTTLHDVPVDVTLEVVEGSSRGTLWRNGEPRLLVIGAAASDE